MVDKRYDYLQEKCRKDIYLHLCTRIYSLKRNNFMYDDKTNSIISNGNCVVYWFLLFVQLLNSDVNLF